MYNKSSKEDFYFSKLPVIFSKEERAAMTYKRLGDLLISVGLIEAMAIIAIVVAFIVVGKFTRMMKMK